MILLVWSWCLCAFVLVVSFVSFFGPLVLPYFPLWKSLPDTELKGQWRDSHLEAQHNNMEFSADCLISENTWPTTNGTLEWLLASSAHQCNLHSWNHQDDRWCAWSTVHPRSKVRLPYTIWVCYEYRLNPEKSRKQARMCYECGV
jgi:hypothetical protein